ncbi:MAG: hypothetical protein QOI41_6898 [Myxococcales bacterium]|nr:hypothetical protein [Myxococcales bacterium]
MYGLRMRTTLPSIALSIAFIAQGACSGGSGGTSGGGLTGGGNDGSAQMSGSLGGETFTVRSGLGRVGTDGSIDVILSDAAGLCDAVTRQRFRPSETLFQAYHLIGTAPGTFTTSEIKYASVAATCPSGQPVEGALIDKKGRATTSDVTLSTVTSSVIEGKLTVSFDDGSSVSGTFSVPICAASESENAACQ